MTETAERIVLASRPVGEPTLDNFRLEGLPIPQSGPDQMLLSTAVAFTRPPHARPDERCTVLRAKPVGIGDVMEGGAVSEVVASNVARFARGSAQCGRLPRRFNV
jgi:NADPH-dependent curcumin reductase